MSQRPRRREFRNEYVIGDPVSDHAVGAEGQVLHCRKRLADGQLSTECFAVKVFKNKDRSAYAKMKKQVMAMEATGHTNIMKTYDHFDEEDDGTFYVVMELAHDELFDHCVNVNGNGPMPEKGLQLAVRQLLRGLAHAHLRGIMHLDLKMENIMLKNPVTRANWAEAIDSPDAPIQLKIMDYGFCEFSVGSDDNVRWAGAPPGTEGYRAPEVVLQMRQVSGAKITVASDMFSLGCVLYVMATGIPAFRCNKESCRKSGVGCVCHAINTKLIALAQGKPEGNWVPITDPRIKSAQDYSPMLQELMTRLLDPNPSTRITAAEALQHPWVRGAVCGPSSPSSVPLPLPSDGSFRRDSFLEDEKLQPVRLKKAQRTHMRRFEFEALSGVSCRSSGAEACAAAVGKIKKLRMTAGASESDVDLHADPEHQLVDFILSDDAETCRMALISLTTQMASLSDACNFIKRLHVLQNLQRVFTTFYKKVSGKMPKLLELLELLADHRDSRILEELLLHKELIDFIILSADCSRPSRTFLKAQRIIVRCMQTADIASDSQTVSRVLQAFSPTRLICRLDAAFFKLRSDANLSITTSRRCAIFLSDEANAAKALALGFEPGRPYYIVNGTKESADDAHSFMFQLADKPGGACITPQPLYASRVEVELYLHVADPFTDQPQQRSAVHFIVDLLCQADKLESDFLFVNYHQDIIVGLFESLFKAAMTREVFDDIVRSNAVQAVLKLLLRRLLSDIPSAASAALSPEEQQRLSIQRAQSQLNASIGPWAVSTPRCEYALRFLSAVFEDAARRSNPQVSHSLSFFYPGSAVEAAAASTDPGRHFHSLLNNVLDICETVAREELLGDTLKVILDIKRRATRS